MPQSDSIALIILHIFLVLFFLASLISIVRAAWRKRRGAAELTVIRGERSLNALLTLYVVATVVYSIAIDVAETASGHKSSIIVVDYAILTYLFFFNSWFRNSVVFKALQRIERD